MGGGSYSALLHAGSVFHRYSLDGEQHPVAHLFAWLMAKLLAVAVEGKTEVLLKAAREMIRRDTYQPCQHGHITAQSWPPLNHVRRASHYFHFGL